MNIKHEHENVTLGNVSETVMGKALKDPPGQSNSRWINVEGFLLG